MSNVTFGEIIQAVNTEVKPSGVMSASKLGDAISSDISAANDKWAKNIVSKFRSTNDNLVIPVGTKTLIGKDFSELYLDASEEVLDTSNGQEMTVLKTSGGAYETEMHGGYLSRSQLSSYADLDLQTQLVYETVLLSKKYAYQFDVNNPDANRELEEGYKNDLCQYMTICEENGLDWDHIVRQCSIELQTETRDYLRVTKKLIPDTNYAQIEQDRVVAVRANRLIVSNANEGYEDQIVPALADELTQEDMENYISNAPNVDSGKDSSQFGSKAIYTFTVFVKNIADRVKSWWENRENGPGHKVGKALKENLKQDAENILALENADLSMASIVADQNAAKAENGGVATNQQGGLTDALHQATNGIDSSELQGLKDSAGQVMQDIKNGAQYGLDNMGETGEHIREGVGYIKDEAEYLKNGAQYGMEQMGPAVDSVKDGAEFLKNGAEYGWEQTEDFRNNMKQFGGELIDGAQYGIEQTNNYITKNREAQAQSELGIVDETPTIDDKSLGEE